MADDHERDHEEDRTGDGQVDLHERFFNAVLEEIDKERYPSSETLNLLQSYMTDDDRRRIASGLMDKLVNSRYPSPAMLRRIAQLVG